VLSWQHDGMNQIKINLLNKNNNIQNIVQLQVGVKLFWLFSLKTNKIAVFIYTA